MIIKQLRVKFALCGLLLMLVITILMTACQQEEIATLNPTALEDQEILDFLEEGGIHAHDLKIMDDFVLYQDDAGWNKTDLLKVIREETIDDTCDPNTHTVEDRQRSIFSSSSWNAVGQGRIKNIRYYIHPSVLQDCGQGWVNGTVAAANAWTNLGHSRVQFRQVSSISNADIIIGSDKSNVVPSSHRGLPSTTIARAGFPTGKPFRHVSINDVFRSIGNKKGIMMHEFGHCLGYTHTDTSFGEHVHGTPNGQAKSIMNSTSSNIGTRFQSGDVRAIRLFYPVSYNMPTGFAVSKVSNGKVKIEYKNNADFSKPYYWVRVMKYDRAGNFITSRDFKARRNNNNFFPLEWGGHGSNTFQFRIRGMNFKKDILSPVTGRRIINL